MKEDIIGYHGWWAGGTDIYREGEWVWADSLLPVEDFIWATGQPDIYEGADELCFLYGVILAGAGSGANCMNTYDQNYPICQF